MRVDHIALVVESPLEAVKWYSENFEAEIVYSDETWGVVQLENIKIAFVIKSQHPAHFAFEDPNLKTGKKHRDGSVSVYKKDPWGNIYEIVKYPDLKNIN